MNTETKTAYREARAAYDAAMAAALPRLDATDPLFDTDEQAWSEAVQAIEEETGCNSARRALVDAECALMGEFYNECKEKGADLSAFGSAHLSVRNGLLDLALRA